MREDAFGDRTQMIRIPKFRLDFILHTYNTTLEAVKTSLAEFGEQMDICEVKDSSQKGRNFKINISTEDPTIIFDVCSQFGRIRSVKVEDEGETMNVILRREAPKDLKS